jgi:hypothetical protein
MTFRKLNNFQSLGMMEKSLPQMEMGPSLKGPVIYGSSHRVYTLLLL